MRRRTVVILGIVLALGAVGFFVARTRAAKPPTVSTEEARMGTLVSTVIETGSVESAAEVQILPLVSARVARVLVAEGETVKQGAVLAELDDAGAASRVDVAKAAVARAEAALAVQTRGAKPEEADAQRQAVANARTALAKAKAVFDATQASATADVNGTAATIRAASERLDVLVAKRADAAKTTSADLQTLDAQLDAAKNKVKRLEYQLDRHQEGVDARVDAAEVARDNAAESVTAAQKALDDAAGSPADVLAKLEEALRLARAAAEAGGTAPAVLNAANEVAVAAFLEGRLGFLGIPRVIGAVLERHVIRPAEALAAVLEADRWARVVADEMLAGPAMAGA